MSPTSLTPDYLAWLLKEGGPLLPGLLQVIRMNPVKPIFTHEFLWAVAVYPADRRAGIERDALGAVQQDRIQAVFDQCPKTIFAPLQRFFGLLPTSHIAQETDRR